ncbi:MAG: TerC/Alx family metal homeostasis membrane protein [Thermoguttaceae bacterium]
MPPVVFGNWLAFGVLVAALLAIDLIVFHRRDRRASLRQSTAVTAAWCLLALVFNGFLWRWRGSDAALQFSAGYLLEWSLSVDNVFVFAVIFRFFQIPLGYQYRVLFWGILGAMVMRLVMIVVGAAAIHRFDWLLPLFGAFLVYSAYCLAKPSAEQFDPQQSWILRAARRWLRIAPGGCEEHGGRFVVRCGGRLHVTTLCLVLLVIESSDVLFALDSVPAIFGISKDPFVIFTSNVFAILGLRALYFLLAGALEACEGLHYGLAAVLALVGLKMIAEWWIPAPQQPLLPTWAMLAVIVLVLALSIALPVIGRALRKR